VLLLVFLVLLVWQEGYRQAFAHLSAAVGAHGQRRISTVFAK